MKVRRSIFIYFLLLILGFVIFKSLNRNGLLIPIKENKKICAPDNKNYQILDFKIFKLEFPYGWKDKGFIVGEEDEIRGKIKNKSQFFVYEYGITATPPTHKLHDYIYQRRNNDIIMGDEIVINETDSTKEIFYKFPIPAATSDTLRTGKLTDSILDCFPKVKDPFIGKPNYYSLTMYNDSMYFIPIEVPDEIANSTIRNFDSLGYGYNLVLPKNGKKGFAKISISKDGFFPFSLWGEGLDSVEQEILINAGLSLKFNNQYRLEDINMIFNQGDTIDNNTQ